MGSLPGVDISPYGKKGVISPLGGGFFRPFSPSLGGKCGYNPTQMGPPKSPQKPHHWFFGDLPLEVGMPFKRASFLDDDSL